jgi:uncharacterized protein (DUF1015 family)
MASPGADDTRVPLRLDPIQAVTYTDHAGLRDVTSPPYDVIGPDGVSAFEAADPHNVVRLILPREGGTDDRYHHAARDLDDWLESGVLTVDRSPALWVYRHETSTGTAIGLVGAVGLDGPVLPHESTFPGPVADRVALMSATRAQLEPILLTYQGDGPASDAVDAALITPAAVSTVLTDGSRHDLWRLDDPGTLRRIADDLAPRRALIADGHHRFAAYERVHETFPTSSTGTGLAVLVDAARHPLQVRGVHRVVAGIGLEDAVDSALKAGFETIDRTQVALPADRPGVASAGSARDRRGTVIVGDGTWSVRMSAGPAVFDAMPTRHSSRWRRLDAAVLKHGLIGTAWGLDDADDRVSYVHDEAEAIRLAARHNGVAALVPAPGLDDVMALAEAGETMPQKSTSFGPKPRTGLIMRSTR